MTRYPFEEEAPNAKLQTPEKFQPPMFSESAGASPSPWGEARGEGELPSRLCERSALAIAAVTLACLLASANLSHAFCGFYVAKADTTLFNKASQVVLVRNEDKTVLTMANDYQGDPKEFAIVIPVPTFLERDQIHIGDKALLDHLDAYSAPRLVEYFDSDPCAQEMFRRRYALSDA